MNFSFVYRLSIPLPSLNTTRGTLIRSQVIFSADGSKFAVATCHGRMSVWDIRSEVPSKTFMESEPKFEFMHSCLRHLQFSSGNLGKEVLVFAQVGLMFTFWYSCISNRWSESLERSFHWFWDHSCDRCNIVWDRRNPFLRVCRVRRSGCAFLRSKQENSVCWTWRNTLWMGPAEKWSWSRMVDWGGVECLVRQRYFLFRHL